MHIFVNDPVHQTMLFGAVLITLFVLTLSKKENYSPLSLTNELKGFAILGILFAHIGYSLSANPEFLFPFSVFAGVCVNLFLFLSGYGLTFSQIHKGGTVLQFYTRRLSKLFIPFWIVLALLFLGDSILSGGSYTKEYIFFSIIGIFPQADMFGDINSPFWYFTIILFYYLLFPLVFFKSRTWITAAILYFAVWYVVKIDPPYFSGVIGLYEVHMLAFPLGVLCARYLNTAQAFLNPVRSLYARYTRYLYPLCILLLSGFIAYVALHGNVGEEAEIEEVTSVLLMFGILLLFILKKSESKLFGLFGLFSYEIYLFHWPLLSRYDFLYTHIPAWIATILYLGIFLILAQALLKTSTYILQRKK